MIDSAIDVAAFKNYLRAIQTACDRASMAIDNGDRIGVTRELRRAGSLLLLARLAAGVARR